MTRDDDFIGQLEGYLDEYEGITPLPDEIRSAVRADVRTTTQIPRRFPLMSNRVRLAVALVAVAFVALGGIALLSKAGLGPFVGSPPLRAYVVDADQVPSLGTLRLTFMIPDGWTDVDGRGVRKGDVSLIVWRSPYRLWTNPCHWTAGESTGEYADPPVMRSLDYLPEGFWLWWGGDPRLGDWAGQAQPTLPRGTAPTDAMVDTLTARYVEFRVPENLNLAVCDEGKYRIWTGLNGEVKDIAAPGELNRLWIFSAGQNPTGTPGYGNFVIVDASSLPTSSGRDVAELDAIVDSIRVVNVEGGA